MTALYINGRILLREHGGVRRYAGEVADRVASARVIRPRTARRRWSGRVWEQTTLLNQTADGVLLNMAHSGPARHPRQVNVIHDLFALKDPTTVHPAYAALMRLQIPRLVANARRLVTVSAHMADEISAELAIDRASIAVVPPGISDMFVPIDASMARDQLGIDLGRPVVAALLDPTPRKNSVALVEVLRSMQHERPDVQIVVAGRDRPPGFSRVGRQRLQASRTGFIDLGTASDADLAAMYQAADVFLSVTNAEGFGLPAVEAASCGAAVVSTPVPSMIEHCATAAVIIESAHQAHAAVLALLDDPGRRAEMTAQARELLCDLRWDKTAASLEAIMSDVAEA